jgi:hypothetical protein
LEHDLSANAYGVCREGKPLHTPQSKCGAGFFRIMLSVSRGFLSALRDDPHRNRIIMRTPTALVTAALVAAILVAASLLIAAGTRGEDAPLYHLNAPTYDHS